MVLTSLIPPNVRDPLMPLVNSMLFLVCSISNNSISVTKASEACKHIWICNIIDVASLSIALPVLLFVPCETYCAGQFTVDNHDCIRLAAPPSSAAKFISVETINYRENEQQV